MASKNFYRKFRHEQVRGEYFRDRLRIVEQKYILALYLAFLNAAGGFVIALAWWMSI